MKTTFTLVRIRPIPTPAYAITAYVGAGGVTAGGVAGTDYETALASYTYAAAGGVATGGAAVTLLAAGAVSFAYAGVGGVTAGGAASASLGAAEIARISWMAARTPV